MNDPGEIREHLPFFLFQYSFHVKHLLVFFTFLSYRRGWRRSGAVGFNLSNGYRSSAKIRTWREKEFDLRVGVFIIVVGCK